MQLSTSFFERRSTTTLTVSIDGKDYDQYTFDNVDLRRYELYNPDFINERITTLVESSLRLYFIEKMRKGNPYV